MGSEMCIRDRIAGDGRLLNWPHHGFWKCMDTLRDKIQLNQMWDQDQARWKTWS